MNSYAPIVLFVYNRPEHTRSVLESLSLNPIAADSELFIFCDGPKENADQDESNKIIEVRKIAHEKKWCGKINFIESEKNKGLAQSIIEGVTSIVNRSGKIIVLEDDILCSPFFLEFMNKSLTIYENEKNIACISAYIYPVKKKLPETFFIKGADCWGWATWENSWADFDPDGKKLLEKLEGKKATDEFDFYGTYPFTQMLRDQIEGKNSSWAIRWYASSFLKNNLCLYPGKSLVQNIGVDGSGTHSGNSEKWAVAFPKECPAVGNILIEENVEAKKQLADFFRELKKVSLTQKIKNKISGKIKNVFFSTQTSGWFGNYSSWSAAEKDCSGYDASNILEKVKTSVLKVKNVEAAFERDSVAFEKLEFDQPILETLLQIASENKNQISIVDFGGSLGSTYFQYRNLLREIQIKNWIVVEQKEFVKCGNEFIAEKALTFENDLEKAIKISNPNVLLLFSVLPYLENPFEQIKKIIKMPVEYIIVDRTAFIEAKKNRITKQVVPESIYTASYPAWFFNENEFLKNFEKTFTLVKTYSNTETAAPYILSDGTKTSWKGFVFKRK